MANITFVYTQISVSSQPNRSNCLHTKNDYEDALSHPTFWKQVAEVWVCFNLYRVCPKREGYTDESLQLFSASAPPASLSLLGNFEVKHTQVYLCHLGIFENSAVSLMLSFPTHNSQRTDSVARILHQGVWIFSWLMFVLPFFFFFKLTKTLLIRLKINFVSGWKRLVRANINYIKCVRKIKKWQ